MSQAGALIHVLHCEAAVLHIGGFLEREAKPWLAKLHPDSCSDEWDVIHVANVLPCWKSICWRTDGAQHRSVHLSRFPAPLPEILQDLETTAHPPPTSSIAQAVGATQGICRGSALLEGWTVVQVHLRAAESCSGASATWLKTALQPPPKSCPWL